MTRIPSQAFIRSVRLELDPEAAPAGYPFSIPAIRGLDELPLDPKVTIFVGENGSGKSTLIEAIAVAAGFNAEGGTKNFQFGTRASHSELHQHLRLVRGTRRPQDGFFLRAESYFNVATEIERLGVIDSYGGRSLHEISHGESFLAVLLHRFSGHGLYLLDEPEAALSPQRQLSLLSIMHDLVEERASQLVLATHSPLLMAYPGALIYELTPEGIHPIDYEQTQHYLITRDFLNDRARYLKHLFRDEP